MNTNTVAASLVALALPLLLAGGPPASAAEVEKNLEQSFTVKPGGQLVIQADRGSVDLTVGAEDKVTVKVQRKASASSAAKAEEILANHEVTFQQMGNDVLVKAKAIKPNEGWFRKGSNLRVHYEVQVPRQFNPDLQTAGGSITIADLAGTVRAKTAGGNIRIGQTEGTVWANTAGGSIEINGASGTIEARTAGGNITIRDGGASVDAETAGGSIQLGKVRGGARARTAGGNIRIDEAGGRIEATTSGGGIHAALTGSPEEDCRFETSAGNIELTLPSAVSAMVDARTSAGNVTTDLPVTVQGEVKRSSLQGKLGDGGKLLKLRTSAGSIRIKAR